MKKILCYLVIIAITASLILPVRSYADSPITSTIFYTAYLDIEEVVKASEMSWVDEETARYLSDPETPIDIKAAIINAIGWEHKDGDSWDTLFEDSSAEEYYNVTGKINADRYSRFIFGKPVKDLDLDTVSALDLFCIGYFMAMDNYSEPERAAELLEKAQEAIPDSFTVAMINAIVKAQVAFGNIEEWNKVWELVDDVVKNKNLVQDMRSEAVEIITNYIIFYSEFNDTRSTNLDQQATPTALITDEPITLTYFSSLPKNMEGSEESFSGTEIYKELENRTNITISFIHAAEEVQLQKLTIMAAAGDIPDLIEFPWLRYTGLMENMRDMDVVIALDDLINKTAPNLHGILRANPEVKSLITSEDGHIYQIPGINSSDSRVNTGPIIRRDLLEKIGLDMPETIDEWEKTLTLVRDIGDRMIPLSFDMSTFKDSGAFIGSFGIPYGFGVREGKVFYGPIEDSYKEFLTTFNRWYVSGLIDPEFILLRNTQLTDRVNSGMVGAFIGREDHLGDSIDALKSIDSSYELVPVQSPVFQNIDALDVRTGVPTITDCGISISSKNKYPEESMKWIDYAFGREGYMLFNYGIEGLTYTVDDGRIRYTDLIINNPNGLSVEQAISKYLRTLPPVPGYRIDESIGKGNIYQEQLEAIMTWSASGRENSPSLMPPVSLTQEESNALTTIMDNLSAYKEEMFAKYVIGAASLDDFDAYVITTKQLGLDRATEIMQTALDRYYHHEPTVIVNGKVIETDTQPVVFSEGEVLVPVRFVVEALGGSVAWNQENKIVTCLWNDRVVTLYLNSTDAMVNYELKTLNAEIEAINKRTYVPIHFIQEALDVTVRWNENTRTVNIED